MTMSFEEYREEIQASTPYAFRAGQLEAFHAEGWDADEVIAWAEDTLDAGLQGQVDDMLGDL